MGSAELSDERKEALAKALARPRFELIPTKRAREQAAYLPEGTKVAVACSTAQGIENTLLLGEELLERGFRIVPHISARLDRDYDIAGFHVYTFNHVESTERWRQHILEFEQASSPVGSR